MDMSRVQNAGRRHDIFPLKEWIVQVFENNLQKSKFYSGRNYEQTEFRECLMSFDAYCFIFQFTIQKYKDSDIQNYNFACCFGWV
jgi:hypothetical protein